MKILTGEQIRAADSYTIEHEPISSLELMERAAETIAQAICNRVEQGSEILFFVGKGNNGCDGLAVARMLSRVGFRCSVCMVFGSDGLSEECRANYERLPEDVEEVAFEEFTISEETIVVDAVLGVGVSGELRGAARDAVRVINELPCKVISIDLPSGMKTEFGNNPRQIIHADITLTIEFPKLAMLLPEAGECCGEIEVLPIELDAEFLDSTPTPFHYTTEADVRALLRLRPKFSHKGTYGHALLVCGSRGMMGAAILSVSSALRSGCGLVTAHIPGNERAALNASAPSAMLSCDPEDFFSKAPEQLEKYTAVGVGCGLGTAVPTQKALAELFKHYAKPMVMDADALNIIAADETMLAAVPSHSVLTPHPGEFRRLVGEWSGEEEKLGKLRELAIRSKCTVVLKGAYTSVCLSDGSVYFNPTGTTGMAKGGSGDVLTGLITGLMAQGYAPSEAAVLGVWLHGRAGEKAAEYFGADAMNCADIVDFMHEAWLEIR